MNKFEKKNSRGSLFGLFMALLKVVQNVNATACQLFFPHLNNYFRFVVKNNRIFYMSHFFSYYYETANFFTNPLLYLYQSAMKVSDTRYIY